MNKNILNILIIIFISFFLYSCQTTKDALQGKKRSEQKDEFLVQKKNPLAMPPDYEKLPTPGSQEFLEEEVSNASEIKDLLSIVVNENCENNLEQSEDIENCENNSEQSEDIERSILEKIN